MSRIPPLEFARWECKTERKLSECPQFLANPDQRWPPKPTKPSPIEKCLRLDRFGLYSHDSHYSQDIANAAITTRG